MKPLRVPPHSIEAEQSVIGAMLIDPNAVDLILEKVQTVHFYNRNHRDIYSAIKDLASKNSNIDLITVSEALEVSGELEGVGGFGYLGELAKNTPSAANVSAYADIVIERSVARTIISAGYKISDSGYEFQGKSAKEMIDEAEQGIMSIAGSLETDKKDTSAKEGLRRYHHDFAKRNENKTGLVGISTGLSELDTILSGLEKSTYYILAARPGMGKTTLALNFAVTEALNGGYPLFFSLEMPEDQVYRKALASVARVEQGKLKTPYVMTDDEHTRHTDAISRLIKTNLVIDDRGGLSSLDISLAVRKYKKDYGRYPTLIIIDYLQLMKRPAGENTNQEITKLSLAINNMKKEFGVPILVLSQLSRALASRADKRPINSDLRDSGSLEQDADGILFVYRDEVYNPDSCNKGLAEIIVSKNRNGPLGMVGARFMGQFSKFDNMGGRVFTEEEPKSYKKKYTEF